MIVYVTNILILILINNITLFAGTVQKLVFKLYQEPKQTDMCSCLSEWSSTIKGIITTEFFFPGSRAGWSYRDTGDIWPASCQVLRGCHMLLHSDTTQYFIRLKWCANVREWHLYTEDSSDLRKVHCGIGGISPNVFNHTLLNVILSNKARQPAGGCPALYL